MQSNEDWVHIPRWTSCKLSKTDSISNVTHNKLKRLPISKSINHQLLLPLNPSWKDYRDEDNDKIKIISVICKLMGALCICFHVGLAKESCKLIEADPTGTGPWVSEAAQFPEQVQYHHHGAESTPLWPAHYFQPSSAPEEPTAKNRYKHESESSSLYVYI